MLLTFIDTDLQLACCQLPDRDLILRFPSTSFSVGRCQVKKSSIKTRGFYDFLPFLVRGLSGAWLFYFVNDGCFVLFDSDRPSLSRVFFDFQKVVDHLSGFTTVNESLLRKEFSL